jgi:predicted RNA-binding Zn-ribbon protein involved in translation (DUF1610 family)
MEENKCPECGKELETDCLEWYDENAKGKVDYCNDCGWKSKIYDI